MKFKKLRKEKVALFGCKYTTKETLFRLRETFENISLITISNEIADKNNVSGFYKFREIPENIYFAKKYNLKNDQDLKFFVESRFDIGLVNGWQRLVPEEILKTFNYGVFGMHGSPEPLPRGRGRSPLNWSLINGEESFTTNLFKYNAGVDAGEIVGSQKFTITPWDDCHTLHLKNLSAMDLLIKNYLSDYLDGKSELSAQLSEVEPTYFLKRNPEDGLIKWNKHNMKSLFNFIRGQTNPFPGAYSYHRNRKIYFFKGHPWDNHLTFFPSKPGIVKEIFNDASFLISVWDGCIRIIDYSDDYIPQKGDNFNE